MLIRGIPETIEKAIVEAASRAEVTLSETAIDLLRKGLVAERAAEHEPGQSAWDVMRAPFLAGGELDDRYSEIMDQIEAERRSDTGRRVDLEE